MTPDDPRGAHLCGSVPLEDAEAVLRAAGGVLGRHLRRLPDGETGERSNFAAWQMPILAENPAFEMPGASTVRAALRAYARTSLVRGMVNRLIARESTRSRGAVIRIRPGVRPGDIHLGPLGYAACAKQSYAVFARLKREGALLPRHRFQVSLPTPLAPLVGFAPDEAAVVAPLYEAALGREIDAMLAAIPPAELSIQWDVAVEFAFLEGVWPSPFGAPAASRDPIAAMLVRLGDRVPEGVELGYHLCYGDGGHRHFKEPDDTARIAEIAAAIATGVRRPLQWIHFPVPRDRDDAVYLAPLRDLRLAPGTELHVGLLHVTDGAEGARRRIEAARRALGRSFGVAAECGLGRRPPSTIPRLLRLHAEMAAPLADPA